LIDIGVPATVEHQVVEVKHGAKYVAETVQHFITLMDSLKLNLLAVDQLHPQLSDLIQSLHKVGSLPADYSGKDKIKDWLIKLNKLKASDEISTDDARQLLFDLER
jgi:ESCRT-I complex subunit VPS28